MATEALETTIEMQSINCYICYSIRTDVIYPNAHW